MTSNIKLIFTVSLLLNVLFAGAAAGLAYQRWSTPDWHKVKEDLSPEAREIVSGSFQKSREDMRVFIDEARAKKQEIMTILSAEPFDAAAFDQAMAELVGIKNEITARKIQAMKEMSQALPAEDRRKMAEKIAGSLDRGMHGKRRHDEAKDENARQPPLASPASSEQFRQD